MTLSLPTPSGTRTAADALAAAVAHLRGRQDAAGWWKGDLDTNVTMDAEDLLLRHVLGITDPDRTAGAARWIRSQQRADGTWATFPGGPGDLSTTVEAWVALRLAGDDPTDGHMARAASFVRADGGVEGTRVFTRIWLALVGLWSWDDLPAMPPELIGLPRWFPLNVSDWACWARQTVVPLTVVCTLQPSFPVPFGIDELHAGTPAPPRDPIRTWSGFFQRLDVALHAYARVARRGPLAVIRRGAMRKAGEWILARQEADGGWGGIQPPWVYSVMALVLLGYPRDHPSVVAAISGLEGFTLTTGSPDGPVIRLEACQSPVWDTCLAVSALRDGGVAADDPAVVAGVRWLLDEQVTADGDWQVRRPDLPSGGWAFEFANDVYPDTDDTAEVVLALRRAEHPGLPDAERARLRRAVELGLDWAAGMASADGGWGAFDADNTRALVTRLPFCDFGEVIDPPSADVTAHVVEALAAEGRDCARGVRWLLDHQEPDGSWFGRWGANHLYGTGGVVPALVAAGVDPSSPPVRRAVRWLHDHQNDDGGWGEDLRSYRDPAWIGRGVSTPSQTAWALLALVAAGDRSAAAERGVRWLVEHQRADGGWDEEQYTGTGFPGDFYIAYHLYRVVFPISALGRWVHGWDP
ncbi:squalene--hopene cyclase [Actinomycetospora cinnamomea]|uniref:Squalene-hopene/tetraprenyl-beta-curcumene cyclase n=1 Tax=Actinomycetospora cinnamomea TaxID=663609 RepID=A0A2U1F8V6_9PSEU|nr:squalene--hopene cyclase [Actinomycetospora cinnamomea]PVZ08588.1 squalene-hopene/tetraprenyl-beta-curcumene cyclase [Actinomycetospora cinnamomea]